MLYKATINEFRTNLADFLGKVSYGAARVEIYKFGKPMALLSGIDVRNKSDAIVSYRGFLGSSRNSGVTIEDRMRRSNKEKTYLKRLRTKST